MEKNLDSKGRWRNKIVAFRVSPEEAEQIDACVRLSGLSKQDYITKRLTDREIVVQGNPRVYKALRNQMAEIYEELKCLEKCSEVSPEEAEQIDACVRLSGLSKQDYITKRLTDREIVVQGNPRVYKALRNQMAEIYEELKCLEKCSEENEELLSTLRLVAETLYGLKGDNE